MGGKQIRSSMAPDFQSRLYRDILDPASGDLYSVAYRVVRVTAKYAYVSGLPEELSGRAAAAFVLPTDRIRLSRQALTDQGYAFVPLIDVDDPVFFTRPIQERQGHYPVERPGCFERLDLPFPSTADQVRSAYRKQAKRHHPDAGGEQLAFLRLQADYERALRLCATRRDG